MLSLFAMVAMPPAGERRHRKVRCACHRRMVFALFIAKYQATLLCVYQTGQLGGLSYQFTALSNLCLMFALSHASTQGSINTLPSYTLVIATVLANRNRTLIMWQALCS